MISFISHSSDDYLPILSYSNIVLFISPFIFIMNSDSFDLYIFILLTGMLVPMAMTTRPMVYVSMLRIQPARLTRVTIPKLRAAIHSTDIRKLTKNHFLKLKQTPYRKSVKAKVRCYCDYMHLWKLYFCLLGTVKPLHCRYSE